jgi:vancomycin permeability regulator SanA
MQGMRWFRRHPVWTVLLVLGLVAALLVGGAAFTVWRAAHHDAAADLDHADAIVVLGAAQYNGVPSPVFQGRLDHAVLLWQQGRADIMFTVGSKQPGDRYTEAGAGRAYLIDHGVPADRIVAVDIGHSTFQSLQAVTHEMHVRQLSSAFLVSDPWHNARIVAMADDLGVQGYASATWTSADASQESRAREYVRETFAYLYYRLFGG